MTPERRHRRLLAAATAKVPPVKAHAAPDPGPTATLRVLTLNLAHGRATGAHQALQRRATVRANLDAIAAVWRRTNPDLVAVQEADGPSWWSGGFDHVERLAKAAGFSHSVRGEHVSGLGLHYGTALLSRRRLSTPLAHTFKPTPPTFAKGFTVATVAWPGGHPLDVVSVHLDFASAKTRRAQVAEMIAVLAGRGRPLIVMGDFNAEATDAAGPVATLAAALALSGWRPAARDLVTFPATGARLDHILVSSQLEFLDHRVLADVVSDHRAVAATLRLRPRP